MKNFFKFLISKVFFLNLVLAIIISSILTLLALEWLKMSTNHNEVIEVPDLSNLTLKQSQQLLEAHRLNLKIIDTAMYFNEGFEEGGIIRQFPPKCSSVKEGRFIEVVVNRNEYREIPIPKVVQVTKRNAELVLQSIGFNVDSVIKVPEMGRNMVYGLRIDGESIEPGDSLPRTSGIDLVVGTGL